MPQKTSRKAGFNMIAKSVLLLLLSQQEAGLSSKDSILRSGFISGASAMDITDETSGEKLYSAPDSVADVVKEDHAAKDQAVKGSGSNDAQAGKKSGLSGVINSAANEASQGKEGKQADQTGRKAAPKQDAPEVTRSDIDQDELPADLTDDNLFADGQGLQLEEQLYADENDEEPEGLAMIVDPKNPVRRGGDKARHMPDPMHDIMSQMIGEDIFDDDEEEDKEGDYIQEKTTKDGRHIHKEVHNHNGVKQVRMTVEGGGPGGMMSGPPPGLLGALLGNLKGGPPHRRGGGAKKLGDGSEESKHANPNQEDFDDLDDIFGGGPLGGGEIHIMGGPMIMGGRLMEMHNDHEKGEDEHGIPPEIKDLMRLTEAMIGGGGGPPGLFGHPPIIREIPLAGFGMPRKPEPRHDESHEDVMARMQRMTEELDQIKNRKKANHAGLRIYQLLAIAAVMILVFLAAFVMTCRANAKNKHSIEEEGEHNKGAGTFDDQSEITEEPSSDRGMKKGVRASKSD